MARRDEDEGFNFDDLDESTPAPAATVVATTDVSTNGRVNIFHTKPARNRN